MGGFPSFKTRTPRHQPVPGPTIKRHKSVQVVETPGEFVAAVTRQWGGLCWDLAATAANCKAEPGNFYGPGSLHATDSLQCPWHNLSGNLWLNHEWGDSATWTAKVADEARQGARIILLSRASVDANWWVDYVAPFARSYTLTPRLTFVGSKDVYPAPLAISLYNIEGGEPGLAGRWHWRAGTFDWFR